MVKRTFRELMHYGVKSGNFEVIAVYDGLQEGSGRFKTAREAANAFVQWNLESARKELKDEPDIQDFYCTHQHATVRNVKNDEVVMFVRLRNPHRGEKLPAAIIVDLIGGTINGQTVKTSAA
jgi:hypothetical protein